MYVRITHIFSFFTTTQIFIHNFLRVSWHKHAHELKPKPYSNLYTQKHLLNISKTRHKRNSCGCTGGSEYTSRSHWLYNLAIYQSVNLSFYHSINLSICQSIILSISHYQNIQFTIRKVEENQKTINIDSILSQVRHGMHGKHMDILQTYRVLWNNCFFPQ